MVKTTQELLNNIVGYLGPPVLIFIIVILFTQFMVKHIPSDPILLKLSKVGLLCNIISVLCVILTYYAPHLGTKSQCFCAFLWKTSLISFILSLYTLKVMYLFKICVYFAGSSIVGQPNGRIPTTVMYLGISLLVCLISCIVMQITLADGKCYDNSIKYGCINSYHFSNIYFGFGLMSYDVILFICFSKLWINKIKSIMMHSPKSVQKSNEELLKSFKIQLLLTTFCLSFTCIDGIIHIIFPYYFSLSIFILDNFMVAIANGLAFMKIRSTLYNILTLECIRKRVIINKKFPTKETSKEIAHENSV